MKQYKYYIFGYSDYIKNSLKDILELSNVVYFDIFKTNNIIKKLIHRIFISRYTYLFSKILMPLCKNMYWQNKFPTTEEIPILILYEINPLSNKQQWINQIKKEYPKVKIVYIFTNIIDKHRKWRLEQINKQRKLYDLILTFNKKDAEKYKMDYYEGVFSPINIDKTLINNAKESDVYFCGVEKGRLPFLISIYEYLNSRGVKCHFDIIFAKESEKKYYEGINYHNCLINNKKMLANVIKSKCILEVMVDTTQPGSSLRMCESVAFKKKLITNNPFVKEKNFFNPKQMQYFKNPTDINIEFIYKNLKQEEFLRYDLLSPVKLLDYIEQKIFKSDKND